MQEYFIDVIKNHYADFSGRARRKQYWMYTLFNVLLSWAIGLVFGILAAATDSSAIALVGSVIQWLVMLALLVPSLAIAVRRLHDIGKEWTYLLFVLIPIVGGILLLVWYCTDSQPGTNQFGPNPKGIGGPAQN